MVLSGKRVQAEGTAGEKVLGLEGNGQGGKAGATAQDLWTTVRTSSFTLGIMGATGGCEQRKDVI